MQGRSRHLRPLLLMLALLAGCSSLSLGYGQLGRLSAWWIDDYLDLDRAQSRRLDAALQRLHAWHRHEELPHWQRLLERMQADLGQGIDAAALQRLERALDASLRRTLTHAAPLAQPLLASLSEAQWRHLQEQLDEQLAEWRAKDADDRDGQRRARDYARGLSRWLGELHSEAEREARAQALAWPAADAALWRERAARRTQVLVGLRAWARGEHEAGTAALMVAAGRVPEQLGPAEQARRERQLASLLRVLALQPPAPARARWAGWQAELQALREAS